MSRNADARRCRSGRRGGDGGHVVGRQSTSAHRRRRAARIISLVPALTEMLFAIGAGPQVVAVSSFDRYPPEVTRCPRVGALLDPDVERMLSLRPDLVAIYGSQTDLHRAARSAPRFRSSTTGTAT